MFSLTDNPVFSALAVFFTLLFVLNLRSFLKILPNLGECLTRWKGDLTLEDSLQLSRSRDVVVRCLGIPACMLAYSYSLYTPDIFRSLSPVMQLGAVTAVLMAYVLLRSFLNWQLEMHNYRSKAFTAANHSFYNYIIILFFIVFIAGSIIRVLTGDPVRTTRILTWITAISYILYIIRRGQIFASACNPFATILYLCGLELLPTSLLVLSARLL